ncbi:MAG: HAD-IC family P-type ATPase, partial [Bacilli bacterium]
MIIEGLTNEEVQQRINKGLINTPAKPYVKSNASIIASHVFTIFNGYNLVIALFLLSIQAYSSLFFVLIVFGNIFLCAAQEIKSKNTVSKLKMIVNPQTKVVRNKQLILINNDDILLDDIIFLEAGSQVASDAIIIKDSVEVDESLLTGESDPIFKKQDDPLLSGSFILSGNCYAQVVHVGSDNYATKLTNDASNRKKAHSTLTTTFNQITKYTSYLVLPISFLLVYQGLVLRGESSQSIIMTTATSLLGMLPKGLVLLTSLSLAASVVKLGKDKALVQDIFSIETLSRVDVLCLDKTGTLTKGIMSVSEVIPYNDYSIKQIHDIMGSFLNHAQDNNATNKTLKEYFKTNT